VGRAGEARPDQAVHVRDDGELRFRGGRPENRHTVTIELTEARGQTRVDLSQDNNASEESREHSEKNWRGVLEGLKRLLESTAPGARTLMV